MKLDRRTFLRSAISTAALGGAQLAWARPVQKGGASGRFASTLVYVFLRGGIDGLNLFPPASGSPYRTDYEVLRPRLQVPTSGDFPVQPVSDLWGFHPAASGLRQLFVAGELAVVTGTGIPQDSLTRSHFDAQATLELGTPGDLTTTTGWLARHLATSPYVSGAETIASLAAGASRPASLIGESGTLTIDDVGSYHPRDHWQFRDSYLESIVDMYSSGTGDLESAALSAANTVEIVSSLDLEGGLPTGVVYPSSGFGRDLENVGRLLQAGVGLRAATVDYGGWDTHNAQGDLGGGSFFGQVESLSEGIAAFWQHVHALGKSQDVCLVIHSDFGRRARQNGENNSGTDHGSGNVMLVLGAGVRGGQVYGEFSGLANEQLFEGQDVAPVVDFRRVLATVVFEIMGNTFVDQVFPGFEDFTPMTFAESKGAGDLLFFNGFEV